MSQHHKNRSAFALKSLAAAVALASAVPSQAIPPNASEPDDPHYWQQWHLESNNNIDLDVVTAWEMLKNEAKEEVIVAVIDTAFDTGHSDLKPKLWRNEGEIAGNGVDDDNNGLIDDSYGYDFRNGEASVFDGIVSHGTPIAGIIAAKTNNGTSTASVTGEFPIKLMPLQFININEIIGESAPKQRIKNQRVLGEGILRAMNYAIDNGARIINMSLQVAKSEDNFRMDAGESATSIAADFITRAEAWYALPAEEQGAKPHSVHMYDAVSEQVADGVELTPEQRLDMTAALVTDQYEFVNYFIQEMDSRLAKARANNVLVVASGLNADVEDFPASPAPSAVNDNVIKISALAKDGQRSYAIDENGEKQWIAEYGRSISVFAPGMDIVSSMPSNDALWVKGFTTGTSFATPMVTAVAAMAASVRPDMDYLTLKNALINGTEKTAALNFTLRDGSEHQAGMIRAPMVLQQLGYELPQGSDAYGNANAPTAKYTASCGLSCSGLSPVTVTFDASASTDAQGSSLSYQWDFGDGTTASGAVVTHSFDAPLGETFFPSVTVTDNQGYSDRSRQHRVKVLANGVDYVEIQFKDEQGYQVDGPLISGDIRIRRTWWGGRFVSGSGVVTNSNGDEVEVSFDTDSSIFGTLTGSVSVVTPEATYFDSYGFAPFRHDRANSTISITSNDVDWKVIDGK